MKILYVCGDNLAHPACGCAQRSLFLHRTLKQLGDVSVLNPNELDRGSGLYRLFAIPFLKLTKVAPWPFRSVKGIGISNADYDIVVCRYLSNAAKIVAWKIAPCYVDVDDVPVEAFHSVESKRLPRWMRPWCGWLVKAWQWYCLGKCAGAWVANPGQKEVVSRRTRCEVLKNIAREAGKDYNVNGQQEEVLMSVGLMGYKPNSEGVDWFLKNVWLKVHERWPNLKYAIAGGGASLEKMTSWAKYPNVEPLGFVDDIDALYQKSIAVVAPILSGAGTCIKVVEAVVHGRMILCTQKATRGNEKLRGVTAFCDADEFVAELGKWTDLPERQRQLAQQKIAAAAKQANSFETFSMAVRCFLAGDTRSV